MLSTMWGVPAGLSTSPKLGMDEMMSAAFYFYEAFFFFGLCSWQVCCLHVSREPQILEFYCNQYFSTKATSWTVNYKLSPSSCLSPVYLQDSVFLAVEGSTKRAGTCAQEQCICCRLPSTSTKNRLPTLFGKWKGVCSFTPTNSFVNPLFNWCRVQKD